MAPAGKENDSSAVASGNVADSLSCKTMKELKQLCRGAGLMISGNKRALLERLEDPEAAKKQRTSAGGKARKLTTSAVDNALRSAGFADVSSASKCARKAIQAGVWDMSKGLEQVVYRDKCGCGSVRKVTLYQALLQPDNGGFDYEDGNQCGAVCCDNEDCDNGNDYLTRMCGGRPVPDSGKFHNHCTECRGFGTCLGDYREAHCPDCNKHFYAGPMGFECPHCCGSADDSEDEGLDPFSRGINQMINAALRCNGYI